VVKQTLKQHISERRTWIRGLYMLLFLVIYKIAGIVMVAVALFQFVTKLLTGETNQRVRAFGQSLSLFILQIWRFLTFNSEELPFPFAAWPEGNSSQDVTPSP
jgi:hypothetical protein